MASTVIKSVRAKTLPEILIDEAASSIDDALSVLPAPNGWYEFASKLLDARFRGAIKRILRLRRLADDSRISGDPKAGDIYDGRALEVERQFYAYIKETVWIFIESPRRAREIVMDAEEILQKLINDLRLMKK